MMDRMKYPKTIWSGFEDGIFWEVVSWHMEIMNGTELKWNSYITVCKDKIPKSLFDSMWIKAKRSKFNKDSPWRNSFNYYGCDVLMSLPFPGGMTYYERKYDETGKPWAIKVGCDYSHIWDDGVYYNEHSVKFDLDKVITRMKIMIGNKENNNE